MTWHREGTVSITNGTSAVTGVGTAFTLANVGDGIIFAADATQTIYEIAGPQTNNLLTSDTALTLATNYTGTTIAAGGAYKIVPLQPVTASATLAARVASAVQTINGYLTGVLAGLFPNGTAAGPAVSFAAETTTGFFRAAAAAVALSLGGAEKFRFNAAGFGIGMSPTNPLDITSVQNNNAIAQILNSSTGVSASSMFSAANGTHSLLMYQLGTSYSNSGINRQDGGMVIASGAGGLTLATAANQPIYLAINSTPVGQIDTAATLTLGNISADRGFNYMTQVLTSGIKFYRPSGGSNTVLGGQIVVAANGGTPDFTSGLSIQCMTAAAGATYGSEVYADCVRVTYGQQTFSTNGVTRVTLDGSGLVGIGTVSTGPRLVVQGSSSASIFTVAVAGSAAFYSGVGTLTYNAGESTSSAGLYVRKDSSTLRSINSAGTNNATGADYAEYRELIPALYSVVPKGALLGYNGSGLLTNMFADVVGRVLPKSTEPSYVGNDVWSQEDYICSTYSVALIGDFLLPDGTEDPGRPARITAFNAALETERAKWDRIALCGVVPVNISGLTSADIGKHLVPAAATDGTITATVVAKGDLTLVQYIDSFGTIEKIGADGRPLVNVKNG